MDSQESQNNRFLVIPVVPNITLNLNLGHLGNQPQNQSNIRNSVSSASETTQNQMNNLSRFYERNNNSRLGEISGRTSNIEIPSSGFFNTSTSGLYPAYNSLGSSTTGFRNSTTGLGNTTTGLRRNSTTGFRTRTRQPSRTSRISNNNLRNLRNRRINFNGNNVSGTVEILSYPEAGRTTGDFYEQINNLTQDILNTLDRRPTRSNGINLNNIRNNTTLFISSTDDTQDNCSICHESIEEGTILRKLNECSHYFHQKCIDIWLEDHNRCPICRRNIIPQLETLNNGENEEVEGSEDPENPEEVEGSEGSEDPEDNSNNEEEEPELEEESSYISP